MQQNFLGLPLAATGWVSIVLALAPYILHAVGSQWPETLPITDGIAKVIEKILTVGLPIDPTVGQASLGLIGSKLLQESKPTNLSVPDAQMLLNDAKFKEVIKEKG